MRAPSLIVWIGKSLGEVLVCETSGDLDHAVMAIEHDPSPAQKESGAYLKPRVRIADMVIDIENARGSRRSGIGPDGRPWWVTMPDHYGYLHRTEGADGDELDITIGRDHTSDRVTVVDQIDPHTERFDEHKAFLWFPHDAAAIASYDASFSDGSGPMRRAGVTTMSIAAFRQWIDTGETTARLTKAARTR